VLAAGAGAARAGALSRVTRLQWIIASGFIAGALLFVYFYIQISYPGLLQRGFRQPSLMAPAATRPAPSMAAVPSPDTAAATAGTVDIGTVPPAGTLAAQQDAMHTPPGSPPSGRATPADVPAALAASPLLNPPPGSDTRAAGSPGMSAPAQAGTARTAPAPGVRAAVPTGPAAPAAAPTRAPDAATTRASTPPPAADSIQVTRGSSALPVNPALADAFDHLQAGRIEPAQRLYSQVAAAEPRNVDALLGLAAVAQLGNQPDAANRLWLRVLEVEPRNAHAQAALLGQLGRADPAAAESQLKTLISREPSPFLYFTLGNLYADQNRWAQAQQAWFQAHHLQPGNADYAFNLAIGLERISQPRLAITYLRTAIRLAEAGTRPNFDVAAARKRAALLEAAHGAP
jgi:predicted Zn-dependent protease